MPKNRFEQVDEPQADALNLVLSRGAGGEVGRILCPASATAGRLPRDYDSGELPPVDAFRAAIKLANEMKLAIVVLDPDAAWHAEWGELFRDEEEATGEPAS